MKAFPNLSPGEETANSVQVLEEHLHHLTSQCRQWNLWEGGRELVYVYIQWCSELMLHKGSTVYHAWSQGFSNTQYMQYSIF